MAFKSLGVPLRRSTTSFAVLDSWGGKQGPITKLGVTTTKSRECRNANFQASCSDNTLANAYHNCTHSKPFNMIILGTSASCPRSNDTAGYIFYGWSSFVLHLQKGMLLHEDSSKLVLAPGCSRSSRRRTAELEDVSTTRFTEAFTHDRSTFRVPKMAGSSISACMKDSQLCQCRVISFWRFQGEMDDIQEMDEKNDGFITLGSLLTNTTGMAVWNTPWHPENASS